MVTQPAALLLPGAAAIGGTQEEPAGARDPAFVGIGHVNAVEVGGGPGILCGPGAAAVGGVQDGAPAAHGPAGIAVGEKQIVKHGAYPGALGGPVFASIGGVQQGAIGPTGPASLGIGEVGGAELGGGGRGLQSPAIGADRTTVTAGRWITAAGAYNGSGTAGCPGIRSGDDGYSVQICVGIGTFARPGIAGICGTE